MRARGRRREKLGNGESQGISQMSSRFLPRESCVARGVLSFSFTDTTNQADNKRVFKKTTILLPADSTSRTRPTTTPRRRRPARSQPTTGERSRFDGSSHTTTSLTRRLRPTGFFVGSANREGRPISEQVRRIEITMVGRGRLAPPDGTSLVRGETPPASRHMGSSSKSMIRLDRPYRS
jgi:hypothetical protein